MRQEYLFGVVVPSKRAFLGNAFYSGLDSKKSQQGNQFGF